MLCCVLTLYFSETSHRSISVITVSCTSSNPGINPLLLRQGTREESGPCWTLGLPLPSPYPPPHPQFAPVLEGRHLTSAPCLPSPIENTGRLLPFPCPQRSLSAISTLTRWPMEKQSGFYFVLKTSAQLSAKRTRRFAEGKKTPRGNGSLQIPPDSQVTSGFIPGSRHTFGKYSQQHIQFI